MDSETESEQSSVQEIDIVKGQLTTYQMLNADLSKKIQELKIQLNATNKDLIQTRNELMSEKLRVSELRRSLLVINGQCTHFFNSYISNLQQCVERTDLDITIPGQHPADPEHPVNPVDFRKPSKINGVVMVDPNRNNILNTIVEEDSRVGEHFLNATLLVASTPLPSTSNAAQPRQILAIPYDETQSSSSSNTLQVPQNVTTRRALPTRIAEEENEEESEDERREVTEQNDPTVVQNGHKNKEVNFSDVFDITDHPFADSLYVNLDKITVNDEQLQYFRKLPREITESSAEDEDTASTVSNDSAMSKASSTALRRARKQRKRKSDEKPRRSTGRPKRSRVVSSLKEPSSRKKLRRS